MNQHRQPPQNARPAVLRRWRNQMVKDAVLYALRHGGLVSNLALATALGISPRGLRQIMESSGMFIVEIRGAKSLMGPWYRVRPEVMGTPDVPPPLLSVCEPKRNAPKITATVVEGEIE